MKYLVKTLSALTTFEDLILNESELKEYKEYARDQQLLLEIVESKKVELLNDDLFGETITGYSIY